MPQKVRKGEELDLQQLGVFMQTNGLIEQADTAISVEQFSNGYSNLTYLLQCEGQEFVLRKPPLGAVKRGHDMSREYKVLSKLKPHFSKAPQALAFFEGGEGSADFYIMERVNGIILTAKEARKRAIAPKDFAKIADSWLDTFVELHAVDYAAAGLSALGKPEGYIERQVSNWGKQFLKAATEEVSEAHQVMTWMEANQPRKYSHSLIHNDFKYDNVVFANEGWEEVTAVLDWEMCTLGDPLMDLGTSIAYWTTLEDSEMIRAGLPSATQFEGNPTRAEIVQAYTLKSGRQVDDLIFYYVFGLFKIAVIAQQIYYRYSKGLTTDERFAHLDKSARLLCVLGLQAIQKNRIDKLL